MHSSKKDIISNQQILLLNLLGNALHNKKIEYSLENHWEYMNQELIAHTVFALPMNSFHLNQLEDQQRTAYLKMVAINFHIFHAVMSEQEKLLKVFDLWGIQVVLLKGAAAARYYPHPEYRSMGDIDIIVNPQDFERSYQILTNANYRPEEEIDYTKRHIGFWSKNKIHIELHHHFSSSANAIQNQVLDQYIFRGISSREIYMLNGYKIAILPALENGLVLLSHINQHLGSGLGLRQIIDWMCYAEHQLSDEYWKATFQKATQSIGMETLAISLTSLCKKYLSMNSEITWCDEADDSLTEDLMAYILERGNFGRKNS